MKFLTLVFGFFALTFSYLSAFAGDELHFVKIEARNKYERTFIANLGIAIEEVRSNSVHAFVTERELERLDKEGIRILEGYRINKQSHIEDFPGGHEPFHNYQELTAKLKDIVSKHPDIMRMFSIGKGFLNQRDIWCIQFNTSPAILESSPYGSRVSGKPGIIFTGNHHAREHLSAEIPLMLIEFLAENYGKDPAISKLIDNRDIYFVPMVNPDGVEYDIRNIDRSDRFDEDPTEFYRWHRKNMRPNGTSMIGTDLNRNYGYMWGHTGASDEPESEIYQGTAPFSEPETQAIKNLVESRPNLKILLSFHTYSELILYPWGHTYSPVKQADHDIYRAMANQMATWNNYTPQQASDLYITSGDTTDWSYGTLGIYSFTFELSPKTGMGGGFYPGPDIIGSVFQANLKPVLYLIDLADDPSRALLGREDYRLDWLY